MPSPFPGMDPYLEDPNVFPDLRHSLLTLLKEKLNRTLPEQYSAKSNYRTWYEVSDPPDEWTFVVPVAARIRNREVHSKSVAIADPPRNAVVVRAPFDERRESYLQIYRGLRPNQHLITHIEVLSPTSKTQGAKGRRMYRRQRKSVLSKGAHLVEIDLLRTGRHTTAVPIKRLRYKLPEYDYHVCVRRVDCREEYLIYPILLENRLPRIEIPLQPGDGNIEVDLQATFDRAYDAGPYRREFDYRNEVPTVPLDEQRLIWAREQIARWRSSASVSSIPTS